MRRYTDEEIILIIKQADAKQRNEVLQFIYKTNYPMIEHLIITNNGAREDAADIFQDGIIALYHHLTEKKFQLTSSVSTYLYAICKNLWLKKLRTKKTENKFTETFAASEIPEIQVNEEIYSEKEKLLGRMFEKLKEDCRKMLLLAFYEKKSMSEITKVMEFANEQVTRNKKLKCMNKLRQIAEEDQQLKNSLLEG